MQQVPWYLAPLNPKIILPREIDRMRPLHGRRHY